MSKVEATIRDGAVQMALVLCILFHVAAGCLYSDGTCSDRYLFECNLADCTTDTTIATDGLDLDSQSLLGTVPPALFSLTSAAFFGLQDNSLTGTLPSVPAQDFSCSTFIFGANELTGTVPSTISNLGDIELLKLEDNSLSGSIPPSIGSLSSLTALFLQLNSFEGTLPRSLTSLASLNTLFATGNRLTSTLPSSFGSLSSMARLRLGSNEFSGTLPSAIGSLTDLTMLSLYGNSFTGTIPPILCSLTDLAELDLNSNGFTGPLPPAIGSLVSLTLLKFGGIPLLDGAVPNSICNIVSTLQNCEANNFVPTQCPADCVDEFASKCGVECVVVTTEPAEADAVTIALSVSIPITVVVIAIVLVVWLRSRSTPSQSKGPPKKSMTKKQSSVHPDNQPDTIMSVMTRHFLSQVIRLLPAGVIDEDQMTLVAAGGFGRVYVAELVEDLIADERSSPTSPLASPSSSSSMDTGSRVIAHKGSRVALKETFSSLEMDDGGFDGFFNELTILSKLRHANIVQLLGTYESVAHRRGFLVSVYADNGPLSKYYRKSFEEVTFAKRRKWTLHVAQALAYMHELKVVHRDVKPSNVVLTKDWTAQVTDFGISRVIDNDRTMTKNMGSMDYMAPETIAGGSCQQGDDPPPKDSSSQCRRRAAVDVYALGILIAVLFNGKRPYGSLPTAVVGHRVVYNNLRPDLPVCLPVSFHAVMQSMWTPKPLDRPTMEDVVAFANAQLHPVSPENVSGIQGQQSTLPQTL